MLQGSGCCSRNKAEITNQDQFIYLFFYLLVKRVREEMTKDGAGQFPAQHGAMIYLNFSAFSRNPSLTIVVANQGACGHGASSCSAPCPALGGRSPLPALGDGDKSVAEAEGGVKAQTGTSP